MKRDSGFSLIELMIAVAILGILVAIAYPSYLDNVRQTRRSDGFAALMAAAALQERFYTINNNYSANLADIGGASSAEGFYNIAVDVTSGGTGCAAVGDCFTLTATGTGSQTNDAEGGTSCATLTLVHTGAKTPAVCW